MATTFDGNVQVNGTLVAKAITYPSGGISDAAVQAGAQIDATKLDHQYDVIYAQESATDALVENKVIHIVQGVGTLVSFAAGSVVKAAAAGNAVIDLLKNGSTVLSGTITLDSTNTNYILEPAPGYTSTTLAIGDVLEFKLTSTAATKPKGVFCRLVVREDAQ